MALVLVLALSSCNKDKTKYQVGVEGEDNNIGYLSLGGLEASVMIDTENFSTASATRA